MAAVKKKKAGRPPRSLRKAIDAKCKDCIYDNCTSGTWRQQVESCTITDCPLYNVRPRSKGEKKDEVLAVADPSIPA